MTFDVLTDAIWTCLATEPNTVVDPKNLPSDAEWLRARVPGTAAGALADSGVTDWATHDVDALDWWFVTTVALTPDGSGTGTPLRLELDGLATLATVWVDGLEVARSRSMFAPVIAEIHAASAQVSIAIRFESVAGRLAKRMPRGRWRSSMIAQQGLRHIRTTLLGRAPVYGTLPQVVGPWRPIRLLVDPKLTDVVCRTAVVGTSGVATVTARSSGPGQSVVVELGSIRREFISNGTAFEATIEVADAPRWWPHTHGEPFLHPLRVFADGDLVHESAVGFRTIEVDRTAGGFDLSINGVDVFCRGVCWTPLDPVRLTSDSDALYASLQRIRDAGMNMVRVVGTLVYEQTEFWSHCAQLGILVWQDVMLATTDPPEDAEFTADLDAELAALFGSLSGNPALTVVSGGSETLQQPTMLGLPAAQQSITALERTVPEALTRFLPGTPYVLSSPSSENGDVHTHSSTGVAHYFGVGGYLRPLFDVRSARVRFAAECLAFSIPPERRAVERFFGSANPAGHAPDWKAAVPRDRGASWDFEDVRDHYVRQLFGVDPHMVRRSDPERYLDLGRAAVSELIGACLVHWRRTASSCAGALVLMARDFEPGAGWGLLDVDGMPKAPWFAAARASAPVAIVIEDDGLDGLTLEVVNDSPVVIDGELRVVVHTETGPSSAASSSAVSVDPHSSLVRSLDSLMGGFQDFNHAHGFGVRTYDAVVAELVDSDGRRCASITFVIGGAARPQQFDIGLRAEVVESASGGWEIEISTAATAQYVCVEFDDGEPSDSWFHLAAGQIRRIAVQNAATDRVPSGRIRALNSAKGARIEPPRS